MTALKEPLGASSAWFLCRRGIQPDEWIWCGYAVSGRERMSIASRRLVREGESGFECPRRSQRGGFECSVLSAALAVEKVRAACAVHCFPVSVYLKPQKVCGFL